MNSIGRTQLGVAILLCNKYMMPARWLELLEEARFCGRDQLEPLVNEADQLMAIFVTMVRKIKAGMAGKKRRGPGCIQLAIS